MVSPFFVFVFMNGFYTELLSKTRWGTIPLDGITVFAVLSINSFLYAEM